MSVPPSTHTYKKEDSISPPLPTYLLLGQVSIRLAVMRMLVMMRHFPLHLTLLLHYYFPVYEEVRQRKEVGQDAAEV